MAKVNVRIRVGSNTYTTTGTVVEVKTAPKHLFFAAHPMVINGAKGVYSKKIWTVTELSSGMSAGEGESKTKAVAKAVSNFDNASPMNIDELLHKVKKMQLPKESK